VPAPSPPGSGTPRAGRVPLDVLRSDLVLALTGLAVDQRDAVRGGPGLPGGRTGPPSASGACHRDARQNRHAAAATRPGTRPGCDPAGSGVHHDPHVAGSIKSGFYDWRSRPESATARRREGLKLLISGRSTIPKGRTVPEDRRAAGPPGRGRRHRAGRAADGPAGPGSARNLRMQGILVACQPRPWRPSTSEQGAAGPIPDLVNRDFSAGAPGAKMVGDITYTPALGGVSLSDGH
jgi:hypothetical protein